MASEAFSLMLSASVIIPAGSSSIRIKLIVSIDWSIVSGIAGKNYFTIR